MPWTAWVGMRLKRTRIQPLHSFSLSTNSFPWIRTLAAAFCGVDEDLERDDRLRPIGL